MGTDDNVVTQLFDPVAHIHLTPWLAALHAQCITYDRMIGYFMTPLVNENLLAWWKTRIAEAKAGTRSILILLKKFVPESKVKGEDLVGVVMLDMPRSETSPFRARVECLLVSIKYRKQGGAALLMNALHNEAIRKGKTLLVSNVPEVQTDFTVEDRC